MAEPVHSPLGASSASRWMTCPGSVSLIKLLGLGSEDSEFAAEGTAAHDLATVCLRTSEDAADRIGEYHHDRFVEPEMAEHVQLYLDHCRELMALAPDFGAWIEHRVAHMEHQLLFGTLDFAVYQHETETLHIRDLKFGAGIAVEADTPQIKYYGFAMLQTPGLDGVRSVSAGIVQPRAHHPDGPIRLCTYQADDLHAWGNDTLLPSMKRTDKDQGLDPGSHCRFCPARFICPALQGIFQALATTLPASTKHIPDEMLGLAWRMIEPARIYIKALEAEVFRRLEQGTPVAGLKLVDKYADRVYRDGAEAALLAKFGKKIYTSKLKTPAQIEKLGADAKALVRQWAYTPKTGQTVAPASDRRPTIKRQSGVEMFKGVVNDW